MNIINFDPTREAGVRHAVRDGDVWYSVDDLLALFEDDRAWWKKILNRWISGAPTREYEDLIRTYQLEGEELRFVNGVGVFRLIQDIPGKKAESVRRVIAERSFEFAQETADPELAIRRAINNYRTAGRTDDWIKARMRNVVSRHAFTDKMQECGARSGQDYAMLTNIVHEGTFAISVKQHKELKGLGGHNLRDQMTELELTLSTLGEQTATAVANKRQSQGIEEAKEACKAGGQIAGNTRKQIEGAIGESVVSAQNFLESDAKSIGSVNT